jgi:iron complex transport system permease protein
MTAATRLRDIMAILILGMMIGSGATAIVEMLQYLTPEHSLKTFVVWTMGSLGSVTLNQLPFITIFTLIGLIISIILIKPLNLLLLGENYAKTSGINIFRVRVLICTSTILLAGTITAFCGPIGFVGIAIPHIARMLIHNADHRILMPASMLLGAIILPLCDIISQLPGMDLSLPINTITALMGIPIIIVIILHNRRFF